MKAVVFAVMLAMVMGSALGVVYAKQRSRTLFIDLQALQAERDRLNVEWGQLQLEQSTWAAHGRVEELARDRLGMVLPEPESVVIVKP